MDYVFAFDFLGRATYIYVFPFWLPGMGQVDLRCWLNILLRCVNFSFWFFSISWGNICLLNILLSFAFKIVWGSPCLFCSCAITYWETNSIKNPYWLNCYFHMLYNHEHTYIHIQYKNIYSSNVSIFPLHILLPCLFRLPARLSVCFYLQPTICS